MEGIKKKIKEQEKKSPKKSRILKGTVFSDKMDKTVTVSVDGYKKHPKYRKRYKITKKYKAHDKKNEFKKGDSVLIQECRPISKNKQWKVLKKID